jgi:nucleoside-diphosphate-sugar epimerase
MFTNKNVFITGAASGIGFDTACLFLNDAAYVIGCDRDEEGLSKLASYAARYPGKYDSILLDVSDNASFSLVEEKIGLLFGCIGQLCRSLFWNPPGKYYRRRMGKDIFDQCKRSFLPYPDPAPIHKKKQKPNYH